MKYLPNFCEEAHWLKCPLCDASTVARFELYRLAYPATPNEPPHRKPHPYRISCVHCGWKIKTGPAPRRRV